MPITVTSTAGGAVYHGPFIGPVEHRLHFKVDLSTLTTAEVDSDGYLKPGVPFQSTGALVAANTSVVFVSVEATPLPITLPRTNTTLGSETGDCLIAGAVSGVINRDEAEDNLGRAYSADELAALAASKFTLTST